MVSVIITTHKRSPEVLRRAVDSVLGQTLKAGEIFVIDDAPEYERHGEIVQLVQEYGGAVQYHVNTRRVGACASRNDGIRMASGEIIALLDDDDEWLPDKLETLVPKLTDDVGLVYGRYEIINPKRNLIVHRGMDIYEGSVYDNLLLHGNFIGGCSVPVMQKRAILDAGMFDEELKSAQDYDLWLRIAKHWRVSFVDRPVLKYYISGDAISASPQRKLDSEARLLRKYAADYERLPEAKRRMVRQTVYYLTANGERKKARAYYQANRAFLSGKEYALLTIKGVLKRVLLRTKLQNR